MPERLRAHRAGIDRLLQHVVSGVIEDRKAVNLDSDELWMLLDALPVALLVGVDRECSRILGNVAAYQLYQISEGQNFSRTAPPGELPPFEIFSNGRPVSPDDLPLQRAARTGESVAQSECEIRFASGRRIFIAGHSIPIRDSEGEVCGSVGAFLDLTPHRQELEISQVVSREMSHRLKNVLAIVQSISRKTLKPNLDPKVYRAFEDRLISLAKSQDLLRPQDWKSTDLARVVETAMEAVGISASQRIRCSETDLTIPATSAITLSMILHELATNALKHGPLGAPEGQVEVTWTSNGPPQRQEVKLSWREIGGPPVATSRPTGFGTQMMASVAAALPGGRLDLEFAPEGLRASLAFRLEDSDETAIQ